MSFTFPDIADIDWCDGECGHEYHDYRYSDEWLRGYIAALDQIGGDSSLRNRVFSELRRRGDERAWQTLQKAVLENGWDLDETNVWNMHVVFDDAGHGAEVLLDQKYGVGFWIRPLAIPAIQQEPLLVYGTHAAVAVLRTLSGLSKG